MDNQEQNYQDDSYGKRPFWQWLLIYLVIGGVIYALVYFLFFNNGAGSSLYENDAAPSPNIQQEADQPAVTQQPAPTPTPTTESDETSAEENQESSTQNTVEYTSTGFTPATITIQAGETVTWTNSSPNQMWVASAVHPTHANYNDTTFQEHCDDPTATPFDQCSASNSYSFTFNQTGTWAYHNHMSAADTGTVIVE